MAYLQNKAAGRASLATTKQRGDAAEDAALEHLQAAGLGLVARNYRTPGRGGGEIDLIMRDPRDGTLVFVEVRGRSSATHGGAGGSITGVKQRRIIFAARHYISRLRVLPPCRFDVVLVEERIDWIAGAFDAG
ncbi:YraN family protein [Variovorax saccharolyticus]|uniref:YraN family protein n=1 Tax=Variovorax saccharolyticus TaxID=3053516 RepID=UPI002577984D|nr:YraN family protein [Variovorax sp. J22R187]MDM0017346.1 YraN family protein [Variovorax sp. J22R187]